MRYLLTNATLVSMESGDNGYHCQPATQILIENDRIAAISTSVINVDADVTVIDCHHKLVTPGLIDSHTHLVYAGNRANEFEQRLQGVSYQEIARQGGGIISTVKATRAATIEQLIEQSLPRLDALMASGVTTVEIKSGYGLTLADEIKMLQAARLLATLRSINIETTLLAAHAVPPEFKNDADGYIAYVCEVIIPAVAQQHLASSVDVFCESIGFTLAQTEKVFQCAQQYGLAVKGHTEQLSNLGGSALTARYNGLSVDHIEYLDEQGVLALANSQTVATLLPGAFYFLGETHKPPVELLRQHQIPMAVASDVNPGTSPFSNLNLMMNMACTLFGLTPQESLRGVTCHAAQALGLAADRGIVRVGLRADLAIWHTEHPADLSYQVGPAHLYARVVNGTWCSATHD
jgi:imidazolonepropionase